MKPRPLFYVLVLLAAVAPVQAADVIPAVPVPARAGFRPITLNFPGGSLKALVDQLTKIEGVTFNLITGDPTDTETVLPPLTLTNLRLTAVIDALRVLLRSRGYQLDVSSIEGPDSVVCVLQRLDAIAASMRKSTGPQFETFQVGGALKNRTIDQVTEAIQAAWEFSNPGTGSSLKFKYHEPSGLLFVEGSDSAFKVVRSVLMQLGGGFSIPTANMYPTSLASLPSVTTSTAAEQARLDQIADEVRKRRAERLNGSAITVPAPKAPAERK